MSANELVSMSDQQLHDTAVAAIWRAAAGEANGGDDASYRDATELMEESKRRLVAAGHNRNCGGGIYDQAYEQATAEHAYRTPEPRLCTCRTFA